MAVFLSPGGVERRVARRPAWRTVPVLRACGFIIFVDLGGRSPDAARALTKPVRRG